MNIGQKVRYQRNGEVYVGSVISWAESVMGVMRYETSRGHWITREDLE